MNRLFFQNKMASEQNCFHNTTEFPLHGYESATESLNCEKLNYEEERIKSFTSWPVHFPVDPNRLAKAGFYYTGSGDDVVCFSCKGHVKNWNYGDIVLKKHADLYPSCDFINNRSNNVPLAKTSLKSKTQPFVNGIVSNMNSCSHSNTIDYEKMKSGTERLQTYSGKWPLSFISASSLANAGFFYTGIDTKVQCPYCKGVISNWSVDSMPFQEHLRQFPWCDFLSENISQIKNGPSWFQSSSEDVCGNMVKKTVCPNSNPLDKVLVNDNLQHTNLEDLGVHLHKDPFHPHQASVTARLKSFETWPSDAAVLKEDLVDAGFFYTGVGDRTICFHCNGGLCTWEKGDDPWVEHARWFSACDFLRLNKGIDFIRSCTAKSPPKQLKENLQSCSREPLLKKVDEAMKSNLVKYILETELFPPYIIRAAILLQIKQTGNSFGTVDDLCVAASYLKEKMEMQFSDIVPIKAEDLNIFEKFSESCRMSELPPVNHDGIIISTNSHEKKCLKNDLSEKQQLEDDDLKEQCICKICMDKEVGVVFLPCGHLPACTICAPALKHCPMCRKSIQATVRVYLN